MAKKYPSGSNKAINSNDAVANLVGNISAASLTFTLDDNGTAPTGITYAFANFPDPTVADLEVFTMKIESENILLSDYNPSTGIATVYDEDTHLYGILSGGQNGRGFQGYGVAPSGATTHDANTTVYNTIDALAHEMDQLAIEALEANKAEDSEVVHLTGGETVAGLKDFTTIPTLPSANPTTDDQSTRKKYVDDTIGALTLLGFGGDGSDGGLSLSSGMTNIALNTVKDYSSMSITGTATLSTSDVTAGIMLLNCTGNITVSSALGIDTSEIVNISSDQTFEFLSADTVKANSVGAGGAGGDGGSNVGWGGGTGGSGGAGGSGYGGGGGGGASYTYNGGDGGAGGTPGGAGGAAGNAGAGGNGGISSGGGGADEDATGVAGAGADAYSIAGGDSTGQSSGGGGGSGAESTAKSGMPIVINCGGNINLAGTEIKTSGGVGSVGGAGGDGSVGGGLAAGGGGGGSSGGGGGADVGIKYTGTYVGAASESLNGGVGGAFAVGGGGAAGGVASTAGTAGANGSLASQKVYTLF